MEPIVICDNIRGLGSWQHIAENWDLFLPGGEPLSPQLQKELKMGPECVEYWEALDDLFNEQLFIYQSGEYLEIWENDGNFIAGGKPDEQN